MAGNGSRWEELPVFPVSHSTLDGDALGDTIRERYGFGDLRCQLVVRGNADVYLLHLGHRRCAVRVWRASASHPSWPLGYEMEFVQHVAARGAAVPNVVAARDASLHFRLRAPEGERNVAVFDWVDGELSSSQATLDLARRIGVAAAELHAMAKSFRPSGAVRRREDADAIREALPALRKVVANRPGEGELYTRMGEKLAGQLEDFERRMKPMRQAVHADIHLDNVLVDEHGRFTIVDFDSVSDDLPVKDIIAFTWRCRYAGMDRSFGESFLAGYETIRPLEAAERAALPMLMAAREMHILARVAFNINKQGNTAVGYKHDLDRYRASIERYLAETGEG